MDLRKKDGGLPPDSVVQTVDEILRDCRRAVEKYHDPSFNSMRTVALAPCSPFSVSAELLRQSALLARSLGVRLHTHLCETKDEENYVLEKYGKRPLAYMEDLGWVGGGGFIFLYPKDACCVAQETNPPLISSLLPLICRKQ